MVINFACSQKEESKTTQDPNQNGYTVVKSANIDLVKSFNEKAFALDTAAVRGFFAAESDTIHDNLTDLNVSQNNQLLGQLKASNVKLTIVEYIALWETINQEANPKGVKNFVIAYLKAKASNGKVTNEILFHQVCAIKDGKIVEEWDIYDTKKIETLLTK